MKIKITIAAGILCLVFTLVQALERADQNQAQAAKLLGMSYDSFRYQLKKFGLK